MTQAALSALEIQDDAKANAQRFLAWSADTVDPREAADWSLAAKNAIAVAVSCETILKIQRERLR